MEQLVLEMLYCKQRVEMGTVGKEDHRYVRSHGEPLTSRQS